MGDTFRELAQGGPLLMAVFAAALAGLVSFLSPCVLPLVPGYLSYVTGLVGADLDGTLADREAQSVAPGPASPGPRTHLPGPLTAAAREGDDSKAPGPARTERVQRTQRVLAGTMLFVGGFTAVYVALAILSAGIGGFLYEHTRALEVGAGALVIVLGLAFLGLVPGLQREWRISRLPAAGLLGAPVFGGVFALSWVPCTGPTLGAVLTMASVAGQTDRAVVLAVAYCLGLGLPFVAFGLGFRRLLGVFRAVRRHSVWVTRVGGALLILVGLALVTGGWNEFVIWLRGLVGVGEVPI